MCSKRRPSVVVGGPFLFLVSPISPPLRFGSALCPVAEETLGRQVSEHRRDGSATIQAQIHHRQALLAPHRSVGFLGACSASCSCLQEEPPSSNPLAYKKSISHTPYGADIDRRSHKCSNRGRDRKTSTPPRHRLRFALFLIDEHFDCPQIPAEVTCVRIRLHQFRRCYLRVPLCGRRHPVTEPLLQLEQAHWLLGIEYCVAMVDRAR
jgi:hypothetical protein